MTTESTTKKRTARTPRATAKAETPVSTETNAIIKSKTGYVVSDKMSKSIVVRVDSLTPHPLYKKRVRKSKRFMVHDETDQAVTGDFVRIVESIPTSKNKSWKLDAIVRAGGSRAVAEGMVQAEVAAEQAEAIRSSEPDTDADTVALASADSDEG